MIQNVHKACRYMFYAHFFTRAEDRIADMPAAGLCLWDGDIYEVVNQNCSMDSCNSNGSHDWQLFGTGRQ